MVSVSRRMQNAKRRRKVKIAIVALVITSLGLWLPLARVIADEGTPDGSGESAPIIQPTEPSPPPPATDTPLLPADMPPSAESASIPPTAIVAEPTAEPPEEPVLVDVTAEAPGTTLPETNAIPAPPNDVTCAVADAIDASPGEWIEITCSYAVSKPVDGASVTAAFVSVPGPDWLLEIEPMTVGESATGTPGEIMVWISGESLAIDTTVTLAVRIWVPLDANPGQQATIVVAADDAMPSATWNVTVSEPVMFAPLTMGEEILACEGPAGASTESRIVYACVIDPGIVDDVDLRNLTIEAEPQTPGWGVGLNVGTTSFGPWTSFSTTHVLHLLRGAGGNPGTGGTFEVIVHVPGDAQPGSAGITTIGVRVCHTWDADPCPSAIDVETIETAVGQDGYTGDALLECVSPTNYTIESGGSANIDCEIESLIETVTEGVHLYSLTLSGLPTGWTALANGGVYDSGANTLAFGDVFLDEGAAYPFTLSISAPCGATGATISLTSSIGVGPASPAPTAGSGPALQFDLAATGASNPATVAFNHGDSTLSLGSIPSSEPIAATWSAGLTITPPGCLAEGTTQSVNLSISAEDSINFNLAGGGDTGRIPLAALTLTGVSGDSGDGIAINPPGSPVHLTDGYEIATIETAGGGDQDVGLTLSLNVDAGSARPGTHSATLTVMITGEDP